MYCACLGRCQIAGKQLKLWNAFGVCVMGGGGGGEREPISVTKTSQNQVTSTRRIYNRHSNDVNKYTDSAQATL